MFAYWTLKCGSSLSVVHRSQARTAALHREIRRNALRCAYQRLLAPKFFKGVLCLPVAVTWPVHSELPWRWCDPPSANPTRFGTHDIVQDVSVCISQIRRDPKSCRVRTPITFSRYNIFPGIRFQELVASVGTYQELVVS